MQRLEPGARVDRYEVVRELGQGGMAVVWEVRHVELGSRHALKVLAIDRRQLAERLVREGQVQARLSHPNLVAVTDVVSWSGRPGLVLEYVDGCSLADWLADHPDADDALRRRIVRQILDAVAHAHAHGTIHRDLKPANVLLTGPPDDPWVKVADFGLAKWLDDDASATRTGIPMGTPRYMAPEQIRDAKNVDERADVFALGCLLYEVWTGRTAFGGDDVGDIFDAIVDGRVELPDDLPADVAGAIRAALRPDPGERIGSVAELAQILDGTRPPPALTSAPIAPGRTRWALMAGVAASAVGGIVALALATALCAGLVFWPTDPRDPATDPPTIAPAPTPAPDPAPATRRPPRPAAPTPRPAPTPAPAPAPQPEPEKGKDKGKGPGEDKGKGHGRDKDR